MDASSCTQIATALWVGAVGGWVALLVLVNNKKIVAMFVAAFKLKVSEFRLLPMPMDERKELSFVSLLWSIRRVPLEYIEKPICIEKKSEVK